MNDNQSNKRQKSVLGPIDDDPFGPIDTTPPPLHLKRQDTLPEMDSAVQAADSWSSNAKEYLDLATKVPIVSYFSDYAAQLLLDEGSNQLAAGCSFLDVCAGPGTYAFTVYRFLGYEKAKELHFVISDFSSGMIDTAKDVASKMHPIPTNMKFEVIDAQDIPIPSNTHDVVGCMFGYFVPDRRKAFSEVCRVCKVGGIAVVGTWKYAGFAYLLDDFLKFLGRTEPYAAAVVAHVCADKESLKQELVEAGFSQVTVHDHGKIFEMPQTDELVLALFHNPMCKQELMKYSTPFLLTEWKKFLVSTVDKYQYNESTNILPIEYVANVVIAIK